MNKFLLLLALFLLGCVANDSKSAIKNSGANKSILISETKKLKPGTESAKFWTTIANDPKYTADHRSFAVLQLILRHFRAEMSLSDLRRLFNEPRWLSDEQIDTLGLIAGQIPLRSEHIEDSVFKMSLCPGLHADRPPHLYVQVHGRISREQFSKYILGTSNDSKVAGLKVEEIASVEFASDRFLVNEFGLNPNALGCR